MIADVEQFRRALSDAMEGIVAPIRAALAGPDPADAAHWEQRHAGAVAEARRQAHRAQILADALRDVLRYFPQPDVDERWQDRYTATAEVSRSTLAAWGALIPDSRRARDWRRNTVLRTRRDADNRKVRDANSRAYAFEKAARDAVELHKTELTLRAEAEQQLREAVAEVKRLKGELGDAPQRIARERAAADRYAHHADVAARDHDREKRHHAETRRRHASTIRQAQREHHRAAQLAAEVEQLRTELADARSATRHQHNRRLAREAQLRDVQRWLRDPHPGLTTKEQMDLWAIVNRRIDNEEQGETTPALCGASISSPLGNGRLVGPCILPASPRHDEHQAADGAKWAPLAVQPRQPVGGDRVRVAVEGDLVIDPRGFGEYALAFRPGPGATEVGYMSIPPHAVIVPLGTNQPGPCWCGHDSKAHVTDGADNAVCRACLATRYGFHQAFHVHAPEQP